MLRQISNTSELNFMRPNPEIFTCIIWWKNKKGIHIKNWHYIGRIWKKVYHLNSNSIHDHVIMTSHLFFVKVVSTFWIPWSSTITKVRHNYSEICSLCWSQKCVCVFWRYLLQIISHYLMNFEQCVLYCSDENFALFEFLLCSFFKTHHAIYTCLEGTLNPQ